jgi:hypothetical protein
MFARSVAVVLVLVLVGPSLVTATCELTCALARHHHGAPSSSSGACHEHQGFATSVGIAATPSSLCHESGELPSAVVEAWLNAVPVTAVPGAAIVITPPITAPTVARAHERSAPFPPRPAHRPLRV